MIKTIIVSQDDVITGARLDCKFCPIAKAVRRAMNNQDVNVTEVFIDVGHNLRAWTPKIATQFIKAFDDGLIDERKFIPFSFMVEFEEEYLASHDS